MGRWKTHADGERVTVEEQDEWVQEKEYATIALRDAASSGWGTAELGRDCLVVETGKKYYWNGASWEKYPATGGAGAPVDASYVTTSAEPGLNNEALHKNLVGANLHVPKTHTHTESDVTDLDHDAQKIKGKTVDTAGLADNDILQYDLSTQKWKPETIAGGGDMTKAVYDGNDDGVVENSDKLEGKTKAQVQDHTPKTHKNSHVDGADKFLVTDDLDAIARVEVKQGGVSKGKRRGINFVAGSGISYNISDDAGNEEVDVNISVSGGGSYKLAPFYTVYKVGSYYFAMDADGNVDYSGTNAATVINAAFGALTGSTQYETVALKGTFSLSAALTPANYSILDMSQARLDVDANVHAITLSSKNHVMIRGGIIDGNKATRTGDLYGIYFAAGTNSHCVVDGVQILEANRAGVWAYDLAYSTIKNCYFYRCGDNAIPNIGAIYLSGVGTDIYHVNILNNLIDNNSDTGGRLIWSGHDTNVGGDHIKIIGNTLMNPYNRAGADAMINFQGSHSVINNNILIGNGYTRTGINIGHGNHNDVVGNYIEDVGDTGYRGGIHITGGSQQDAIVGNVIYNCVRGITLGDTTENPPTSYENVIANNNIDGGARGKYGIYGTILRSNIVGNNVRNVTSGDAYGIGLKNDNQQTSYSMIHDNYIEGCGTGIYENNHSYLSIHNNVVRSCTTYMTLEDDGNHHDKTGNVDWHA